MSKINNLRSLFAALPILLDLCVMECDLLALRIKELVNISGAGANLR
jgi:hypothetical protein